MKTLFIGLLLAVSAAFVSAQPVTVFFYTSSPTSWVGQGETRTFSEDNGWTMVATNFSYPTIPVRSIAFQMYQPVIPNGFNQLRLDISLPEGQEFQAGMYGPITGLHTSVGGVPNLGFTVSYQGSNGYREAYGDGFMRVLGFEKNGSVISSAAIDFLQLDSWDGVAEDWVFGSLRFNSNIPLESSIPEPSTYGALAGILIFGFVLCARRKVRQTNSV
jgi:hypothetical protein